MNILFLHRDFPAQFKYLVLSLLNDPNNNVYFISEDIGVEIKGVTRFSLKGQDENPCPDNPHVKLFGKIIEHSKAAMRCAQEMKAQGIIPDIIYGFGFWGVNLFMKDVFPGVPVISFCEWFYNLEGADLGFDGRVFSDEQKSVIRCENAHSLLDLHAADVCVSPTQWQKKQFPKEYHHKFKVIHDGIDTDTCSPGKDAKLYIKDKDLTLTADDEVITYGTRGMEPYRGFPQFMEAAEKILKKRPKAHIVIAGADHAYYGALPEEGTYKEQMLKKLDIDMDRIHFVGGLSFYDYINFLRVSSAHVYSTYPYILSWSILNAMSSGCCVVASSTAPVLEIIRDNYNGLLFDFYDIDQQVEKIEYALDNKEKAQEIRENARQFVLDYYDVKNMLMQQVSLIYNTARKK